jgi:hypothetical protein
MKINTMIGYLHYASSVGKAQCFFMTKEQNVYDPMKVTLN